jgi:Transposase
VPMSGDNFSRRYSIVAETRRKWSDTEKQAIVAQAAQPGANISAVARRHGIKPSLLFRAATGPRSAALFSRSSIPACHPGSATGVFGTGSAGSIAAAKFASTGGSIGGGRR